MVPGSGRGFNDRRLLQVMVDEAPQEVPKLERFGLEMIKGRGAYFSDHPEPDDGWLRSIILKQERDLSVSHKSLN
jgi:hypothetical protein